MRYVLLLVLLLLFSACTPPEPTGDLITYDEGDQLRLVFANEPNALYYLDVDGLGPAGVSFRGVKNILKVGEPIRYEVSSGKVYEIGLVKEINTGNGTVTVLLYDSDKYKVVELK